MFTLLPESDVLYCGSSQQLINTLWKEYNTAEINDKFSDLLTSHTHSLTMKAWTCQLVKWNLSSAQEQYWLDLLVDVTNTGDSETQTQVQCRIYQTTSAPLR